MASAGELISYETLHTSRVEQTTGWKNTPVGYTSYVFIGTGAKIELEARDWITTKNEIGIDVWGCKNTDGYTTEGFASLKIAGNQHINVFAGWEWRKKEWYHRWENEYGNMIGYAGTVESLADFFAMDVYTASGDEKHYRLTICPCRCFTKAHWSDLVSERGDSIKGRGWFTDRWWGIARIDGSYTGTQGAPGSDSIPVFTTLRQAILAGSSYTGTHINSANWEACFPSAKSY